MSLKFRNACFLVSLCFISLLNFQGSRAQSSFSELDRLLLANQKQLGGNVVALVWKDGKLVYSKELGDFNAKTQAPIASASKWLTAAMVMQFVDQGKISLDDPVVKYIPLYRKYMKSYLTIRHCLSQTTGIERDARLGVKLLERRNYETLEDEVNAIAEKDISNNPGQEFFYGGYGLNIAARVCEIVGKKSFDRLVQEKITRPLKMRGTTFTDDNGKAPNPSGGAKSTANDYLNFMIMLLNKGKFEEKQILSEAAVEEMLKIQFPGLPKKYAPAAAAGFDYGFGAWIQEKDANGKAIIASCPGLFGTWPLINRKKNYASIIFVQTLLSEQKREFAEEFNRTVEALLN
jgi:CubicO group peptidase (beta-lactamase class C family)